MSRYHHILGCLLGTAVGDALGLRREGLSRQRAQRIYGGAPLQPVLMLGRGYCSDDTEHTQMVGRAISIAGGDQDQFIQSLARQFRCWLLTMPAGVGFGTLRACLKLLAGFGPHRSGVRSAGNGPAMRAALLGVCAESDEELRQWVRLSTRLTHTDSRAEEGALAVARAAQMTIDGGRCSPTEKLAELAAQSLDRELREALDAAAVSLDAGHSCEQFANARGWSSGVSGYVNHTVPASLYCWAKSPNDFVQCVETAVLLGGDTDTLAAITGAIAGANLGDKAIPESWINGLNEWPRTVNWMTQLANTIDEAMTNRKSTRPPPMHWLATIPRNLCFVAMVLALGLRRMLPPY